MENKLSHVVMLHVSNKKRTAPIHKAIEKSTIELKKLTIYGDLIFTYELACRDEFDNKIVLRKGLISSYYDRLFRFHELDGIELNTKKFKLEITTDPHHGEGWVELEYKTLNHENTEN